MKKKNNYKNLKNLSVLQIIFAYLYRQVQSCDKEVIKQFFTCLIVDQTECRQLPDA